MLFEAPNMAATILQSLLRDCRSQENVGTPQNVINAGAKQRWRSVSPLCLNRFRKSFRHLLLSRFPSRALKADGAECQQIRLRRPGFLRQVPQVISNAPERSVLPCRSKQEVCLTNAFCLRNSLSGTPGLCLGGVGGVQGANGNQ